MKIRYTRILLFLLIQHMVAGALAQDAAFSQFMYNKLTFNPAYAGADNGKICATLVNRGQRIGVSKNDTINGVPVGASPSNLVATINTRLGMDDSQPLSKIGVGLLFTRDKLGFEINTQAKLSLSYKLYTGAQKQTLAFGMGLGWMQRSLDISQIVTSGGSAFDLDLGLYYTSPQLGAYFTDFYAGLSARHVNQSTITYDWINPVTGGSVSIANQLHYYFVTGARYELSSRTSLLPNILVRHWPSSTVVNLNCYLVLYDGLRVGAGYTSDKNVLILLAGYNMQLGKGGLYFGYSYDFAKSNTISYNSGRHEIVLRYCLGVKK